MATVRKRKDAEGRLPYLVSWVDPAGKERKRSFRLRREADDFRKKIEYELSRGTYIEPVNAKITVNELADRWWPTTAGLKRSTRTRYAEYLANYVRPYWGDKVAVLIKKTDVSIWTSKITAGEAPGCNGTPRGAGTVRGAYRILSLILTFGVDDEVLPANVAIGAKKPAARRDPPVYLTQTEVFRLAVQSDDSSVIIYTKAYTGLRFGELSYLRVGDVDLRRRRLHVRSTASEVGGVYADEETTKTHTARWVPIPEFIAELLGPLVDGRDKSERLFTAPKGGPLRENNWRRRSFDPAIKHRVGCELTCAAEKRVFLGQMKELGFPTLTPHNLRDTAASLAVASGASVKAVQRMLGHKSAAMTLDVYSDLWDDDLDRVAERMQKRQPHPLPGTD